MHRIDLDSQDIYAHKYVLLIHGGTFADILDTYKRKSKYICY